MKRLLVLGVMLLVAVGCSQKDKQEVSSAVQGAKNQVKAATGGDGKELVIKFLEAIKNDDIKSYADIVTYPQTVKGQCEETYANAPDYKKAQEIDKCIAKEYSLARFEDAARSEYSYILAKEGKRFLNTASYSIIESKRDSNTVDHFVKVTYSSPEQTFKNTDGKFVKEVVFRIEYNPIRRSLNDRQILSNADVLSTF